jgi:hypothetical protein
MGRGLQKEGVDVPALVRFYHYLNGSSRH